MEGAGVNGLTGKTKEAAGHVLIVRSLTLRSFHHILTAKLAVSTEIVFPNGGQTQI